MDLLFNPILIKYPKQIQLKSQTELNWIEC